MKKIMITMSVSLLVMFVAGCYSTSVVSHENALQTISGTAERNDNTSNKTVTRRTWVNGHYEGITWVRGYFKDNGSV